MAKTGTEYRWNIVVPSHRYIFAVDEGGLVELNQAEDSPADRFQRYRNAKADYPVHGMITWPNTVLLRGPRTVVVDPGVLIQGPPLLLGLDQLGVAPGSVDLVVNTHNHPDHVQANVHFPGATGVMHEREVGNAEEEPETPFSSLRLLEGERGEIAPGLEFLLTPGHTDGSISLLANTAEGIVVVAGDTVGPVPGYFERGELPAGFPGREELLRSWERIREIGPVLIIPGHNPPVTI